MPLVNEEFKDVAPNTVDHQDIEGEGRMLRSARHAVPLQP